MHVIYVNYFLCSVGRLPMMVIIRRNMQRSYFVIKNIVAFDKI
jgi:hypothetical protein